MHHHHTTDTLYGVLINVDAEQPQYGAPVFDKWGHPLEEDAS